MTRARNIAGFSTITTTPSPVHVGPIGVLTATRIDGEFNQVDLATRNITAAGIAATNLQVSGITTGLNVSGIITAQNGINFNGTSTGLNVSGIGTIATLNVSGNANIGGVLTYEDVTNVDSVGIVTARGLSIFGNTTGLRATGISTFTSDVRISSPGRLLMGTTTEGAADADNLTIADSGSCGITLRSGTSAAGAIYFSDATSGAAESDGALIYNHSSKFMAFYANESERLRITSAGNVGIGSLSPENKLKINVTSGNDGMVVQNTSTANSAFVGARNGDATLQIGQYGSTASGNIFGIAAANLAFMYTTSYGSTHPSALLIGNSSNKDVIFATNATERLRITSDGKFAFNYSGSPSNDMLLKSASAHTSLALYSGSESTKAIFQTVQDDDIRIGSTSNHPVSFYANSNQYFHLTAAGALCIGTENTASVSDGESPKLQIKGGDSTAGISIVRYSANAGGSGIYIAKSRNTTHGSNTVLQDNDELGRITFSGDDGTDLHTQGVQLKAEINGTPSGNALPADFVIYTNPGTHAISERVRITANGRTLVRTGVNYGAKFVVNQAENDTMATSGNMTTGFFLGAAGMASAALNIGTDNTDIWFNAAYANNAGVARAMKFYIGGTQRLAIGTNGKITHGSFEPDYLLQTNLGTTNSGTFTTVIPAGTLGHQGVYLVSVFWDYNGAGGAPYYALASFMFSSAATNNTSPNNAENLITSCHVGGNYYLSARSLTASSSTTALQIANNGWTAANGSRYIVKYKRIF